MPSLLEYAIAEVFRPYVEQVYTELAAGRYDSAAGFIATFVDNYPFFSGLIESFFNDSPQVVLWKLSYYVPDISSLPGAVAVIQTLQTKLRVELAKRRQAQNNLLTGG